MAAIQTQTFNPALGFELPALLRRLAAWVSRYFDTQAAAVPSERTRIAEAQAVREMALRVQRTDPSYAADLFAAADRHELGQ